MKKNHIVVIGLLFVFYFINNYIWLSQDKIPTSYDEAIHLWTSLKFARAFIHPDSHNIFYRLIYANATHWPPLFHFTASLVNLAFGYGYIVSCMTNMIFFVLMMISLYLLGKRMFDQDVGITAVTILSFYPIVYGHSRLFQLDFALMAMVTWSVYCLVRSDRFKSFYWSVAFGISGGLGMLTKWSYAFFAIPLLFYTAFAVFLKRDALFPARSRNLFTASLIVMVISVPWYLLHLERSSFALKNLAWSIKDLRGGIFEQISWYLLNLNNNMLSFVFFLLLMAGLLSFYRKVTRSPYKSFITIWCLAPLFILGFIGWKQSRFFMPILPCFALISAFGLEHIRRIKLKRIVQASVFAIAVLQFFKGSYDTSSYRNDYDPHKFYFFYTPSFEIHSPVYRYEMGYNIMGAGPAHRIDWQHEKIAKSIAKHADRFGSKNRPFLLGVIYDEPDKGFYNLLGNRALDYFISRETLNSGLIIADEATVLFAPSRDSVGFFNDMAKDMAGIIYISRKGEWPSLDSIKKLFKDYKWPMDFSVISSIIDSRNKLDLTDTIDMPFGFRAYLYIYNTL